MFRLSIETDNAAFDGSVGDANAELARVLRVLADGLEGDTHQTSWRLYDINGNRVGGASVGQRWWLARINALDVYAVEAPTIVDAENASVELWRREFTPETPDDIDGAVREVEVTPLRLDERLFQLSSEEAAP